MNIPCDKAIACPALTSTDSAFEWPIQNFSSEAPDKNIFIGVDFGEDPKGPPLGQNWSSLGCVAWCLSDVSQEDADLCAARQQYLCEHDKDPDVPPNQDGTSDPEPPTVKPPPGPGPGPEPTSPKQNVYYNTDQRCSFACPDGSTEEGFIPAGTVAAGSVLEANIIAQSLACKSVRAKAICIPKLELFACSDPLGNNPPYSYQVEVKSGIPLASLTASGLPPDLTMSQTGLISGTPTTPGDYPFSITGTLQDGTTKTVSEKFTVLGIEGSRFLPDAPVDHDYNYQFTAGGGGIEFFITAGALPNGLMMDDAGTISGIPDTVGAFNYFTVTVRDAFFNECSREFVIEVTGPKFLNAPGNGIQCTLYSFQYQTDPPANVCTFSGSGPGGTTIDTHGLIHGCVSDSGSFTIHAVADDGLGHTNYQDTTIVLAVNNPGWPIQVKDWTYTPANIYIDSGVGHTLKPPTQEAGGLIRLVGYAQGPGTGQFGFSGRSVLNGFGRCGCANNYDITFAIVWNLIKTGGSTIPAVFRIQVSINGLITEGVDLNPASPDSGSQTLVFHGVNWPVSAHILQADTFFKIEYVVGGGGLGPGERHDLDVTINISPLSPPAP